MWCVWLRGVASVTMDGDQRMMFMPEIWALPQTVPNVFAGLDGRGMFCQRLKRLWQFQNAMVEVIVTGRQEFARVARGLGVRIVNTLLVQLTVADMGLVLQ